MRSRLARSRRPVVTARAGSAHRIVVNPAHGGPGVGAMASLAIVRCCDMRGGLARGSSAVVTAAAGPGDRCVVKADCTPGVGLVACIALCRGRNMGRCLSCGGRAIVATCTASGHCIVINPADRRPRRDCVAGIASAGRRNVRGRLPGCAGPVMTAGAIAGNLAMIEIRRDPGVVRMAVAAFRRCRNVGRRFAGRGSSVVATGTGSRYLVMIDPLDLRP